MQVKSTNSKASQFSVEEVNLMSSTGNASIAQEIWLKGWSPNTHPFPSPTNPIDIQTFMHIKYIDRLYFDQEKMNSLRLKALSLSPPTNNKSQTQIPQPESWSRWFWGQQALTPPHTQASSPQVQVLKLKGSPGKFDRVKSSVNNQNLKIATKLDTSYATGDKSGSSPTKKLSQYSLTAWGNYLTRPTGYNTIDSKKGNNYKPISEKSINR